VAPAQPQTAASPHSAPASQNRVQNFWRVPSTGVQNGALAGQAFESGQDLPTPTEFPDAPTHGGARSGNALGEVEQPIKSAHKSARVTVAIRW
jgi:hypothetical protein